MRCDCGLSSAMGVATVRDERGSEWSRAADDHRSERAGCRGASSALEAAAAAAQGSLELSAGRLLRVVHFRMGESEGERVLLIIHHLAVDGVSWRVLLEELEQGYRQSAVGGEIELGERGLSFRQWAQLRAAAAQ